MMMGIGNLTELTDVDSAGINLILLAVCQELGVESVLTTQVINWSRTSVRECDLARRLVHYCVAHGVPPKRLSKELVILRDAKLRPFPPTALDSLAGEIKDNNYRLFAQDGVIHLISAGLHLTGSDPFELFEQLMRQPQSDNVDPGHAFYLGYEMAKAITALQLGKQYEQDRALDWGHLKVAEDLHRIQRTSRHRKKTD
jgi:dihydropteroate synthase